MSAYKFWSRLRGVWLLGLLYLCHAAAAQTVYYVHTDALGSIVAESDSAGQVVSRREYEPYGQQLTPAVQDGPGYTGHVQDAATGLAYMQQRYYDPQLGVFLSADPVTAYEQPGDQFHRYRYANNNPYKFIDPDGRQSLHNEQPPSTGVPLFDWIMTSPDKREPMGQMAQRQLVTELSQPHGVKDIALYTAVAMSAGIGAGVGARSVISAQGRAGASAEMANMSGMLRDAARGKGNFGIGTATSEQAEAMGRAWVGSGARQNRAGNALISQDGLRQYRFPSEKPNSSQASTGVQANFESRYNSGGKWINNAHLDIE